MTERWRKKLGDLDKQGPSEDVFERAKEGPMHVDEPLPPVRTSTRMLTVVAAFAVFALGISVFAVPALRMGGEAGGQPSGTLPLWPARTADDLHALQAAADAGQADWALDPKQLAGRFVGEVMGWNDPYVVPAPVSDCGQGAPSSAALVSGNAPGAYSLPGASWTEGCASFPYPNVSSLARGSNEMTASISASFGYRTFAVVPCKPLAPGCGDYAVGPTELVSVYQPLRQGVGQIWGVLQARSPQTIDLPMVPGQNVRSGSTVSASVVTGGAHPTIAYTSCGQSAGQEIPQMHLLKNEASLDVSLSPSATCSGPQAGYVWAATAKTRLAGEDGSITVDPLTDTGQYLYSLSAVPVTMLFPDHEGFTSSSSTDMSAPPSTVDPVTWTPFTDPLGWMIDVPTTWQSRSIDASSPTGFGGSGTEFFGGGIEVDLFRDEALAPPPADDSTFPLDPNDLGDFEGGVQLVFRGNGSRYQLLVPGIPAADLDVQQQEIVDHMVASISFEPWTVGERRQEWTAFGRVLPSGAPSGSSSMANTTSRR